MTDISNFQMGELEYNAFTKNKKIAVVIGGNGKLGKAIVSKLQRENYLVDEKWISSDRPDCTLESSYDDLPKRIDLAVYLPGLNTICPMHVLNPEEWDKIVSVNLRGAYLFARKAYWPLYNTPKSTFLTVSSILTTHPYPFQAAYAAAKAGLEGFTRALSVELCNVGISTHCIRLGHLSSPMKTSNTNTQLLNAVSEIAPFVEERAVADYVYWLSEGGSKYVNGAVIDFDSGYSMRRWPLSL